MTVEVRPLRSTGPTGGLRLPVICSALAAICGLLPLWGLSPLILPAAVGAALVLSACAQNARRALRLLALVLLLPPGLLPGGLVTIAVMSLLALAAIGWVNELQRGAHAVWSPTLTFLLLFLTWALISTTWSADVVLARQTLVQYCIGAGFAFLALNLVRTDRHLRDLLGAVELAAWVLLAAGVAALVEHVPVDGERLEVLDMNSNQFGNMLVLCSGAVLWRALSAKPSRRRLRAASSVLYLGSALVLISLSGSRGSLLAFGVLVLALALMSNTRSWAGVAAGVALVTALTVPFVFSTVLERFEEPDPRQAPRALLWSAGLDFVADKPLTGAGVGNGPAVMPAYIEARTDVDYLQGRADVPAHNPLIEAAVDGGLISGALLAGVLLSAAARLLRAVRVGRMLADPGLVSYGTIIGSASLAFLPLWMKSGGGAAHVSTYLLVVIWSLAPRARSRRIVR